MNISIVGDSFTEHFTNTWLEKMCTCLKFNVLNSVGHRGCSQYSLYKSFLEIFNKSTLPDIILITHTEYSRLYHPKIPISMLTPQLERNKKRLKLSNKNKNYDDFVQAMELYYKFLYDEEYSQVIHNFFIENIQNICIEKKVKLINLPAFSHSSVKKFYGLWILCDGGLIECSRQDESIISKISKKLLDNRSNHFSPRGHEIMANNIIPHIKDFINGDKNFCIANLDPKLFA